MAVENSKIIDFVSVDKAGNTVLTISDHLRWDANNKHLQVLQNKINAYLNAIEAGNFYDDYPNAKGRTVVINVIAKYEPNDNARLFLNATQKILHSAGYEFKFSVLKNE